MTQKIVDLMAAPTAAQPGGYVRRAYMDRVLPSLRSAQLEVTPGPRGLRVQLGWSCPEAVRDMAKETDRFVDAAALAVPVVPNTPWITMGAPGKALEGALWRADRPRLLQFHAEGLGSVKRQPPPAHWEFSAEWQEGRWSVRFELAPWPLLEENRLLAFAIWRGAAAERGGLKSISPGWVQVEP